MISSTSLDLRRAVQRLNVIDDFNCEATHIEVDTSISSVHLIRIFKQLKHIHLPR